MTMKKSTKDFFDNFAKEQYELFDKNIKEIFNQTFDYNEPLFNLILKIKKEMDAKGQDFHVFLDISHWNFDVEIEDETPEFAILNEDEKDEYLSWDDSDKNSWDATGWEKMSLDDEFASLLEDWNWDNLRMANGQILLFSRDGFLDEPVFYTFDQKNLVDDIITMWGCKEFADAQLENVIRENVIRKK